MRSYLRLFIGLALLAAAALAGMRAHGQDSTSKPGVADQAPMLSAAQRSAIYTAVNQEKSKVRPPLAFNPAIGAKVPASIALYALPERMLSEIPAIRAYQYTIVQDQVVLVDPTTLQVVDIIRQ